MFTLIARLNNVMTRCFVDADCGREEREAGSISSWSACMEYGEVCRLQAVGAAAAAVCLHFAPARLVWIAGTDYP